MSVSVRKYEKNDLPDMIRIWNEVVEDGIAFPQEEKLDEKSGAEFFAAQTYCGVATDENGETLGLYILHPNNGALRAYRQRKLCGRSLRKR